MFSVKARLITGVGMIITGATLNLLTIVPHYMAIAYNKSVIDQYHGPPNVPVDMPMLYAIPPLNYWLIGIGSILIIAGGALILSALVKRRRVSFSAQNCSKKDIGVSYDFH